MINMKKIILMTALATAVLSANAQDIKPYEEKNVSDRDTV